jgi:hypothetical protein
MEKALFQVHIPTSPHVIRPRPSPHLTITASHNHRISQSHIFCIQWAEESKLLQRAQERSLNEGGVGYLEAHASLLDPKLMSKEPKHRRVCLLYCAIY